LVREDLGKEKKRGRVSLLIWEKKKRERKQPQLIRKKGIIIFCD